MIISGIYQILNIITNKFYIGSSYRIIKRWKDYLRLLNEKRHPNKYLQASWNKHGENSFEFIIVETCNKEKLIEREQFWINNLKCIAPEGYNANPVAGSRLGTKHTKETLLKLKGKVMSEKQKKQISEFHTGRKHTEEQKLKIKLGNLGKKNTEEAKANMRAAWVKRKGNVVFPNSTPINIRET